MAAGGGVRPGRSSQPPESRWAPPPAATGTSLSRRPRCPAPAAPEAERNAAAQEEAPAQPAVAKAPRSPAQPSLPSFTHLFPAGAANPAAGAGEGAADTSGRLRGQRGLRGGPGWRPRRRCFAPLFPQRQWRPCRQQLEAGPAVRGRRAAGKRWRRVGGEGEEEDGDEE